MAMNQHRVLIGCCMDSWRSCGGHTSWSGRPSLRPHARAGRGYHPGGQRSDYCSPSRPGQRDRRRHCFLPRLLWGRLGQASPDRQRTSEPFSNPMIVKRSLDRFVWSGRGGADSALFIFPADWEISSCRTSPATRSSMSGSPRPSWRCGPRRRSSRRPSGNFRQRGRDWCVCRRRRRSRRRPTRWCESMLARRRRVRPCRRRPSRHRSPSGARRAISRSCRGPQDERVVGQRAGQGLLGGHRVGQVQVGGLLLPQPAPQRLVALAGTFSPTSRTRR